MIQSYPPALARANEIFQFHLADERRSPTPPQSPDEVHSNLSENDEEPMTENRSNSIEFIEVKKIFL